MRHLGVALLLGLFACESGAKKQDTKAETKKAAVEDPSGPKVDKGVDLQTKTIRVGALNDESGPAAVIGKPFAIGKRILAAQINAGKSGLLPEGWKIELVEKDHGYNPQKSVQAYNQIKDQVLFIATSFGTPTTLPLRPMLEQHGVVAFPASLSSKMALDKHTPPLGPPYMFEAMRAMDWAVEQAGGPNEVKAGIVYQKDDYGADGLEGWKKSAKLHGVEIVSEQSVAPGQKDMTAAVTALKKTGANYVLLATLPSATGPLLGTAAQLKYMPTWIGNTPSWVDAFFNPKVIPSAVFANYHLAGGLPYWGEELKGMDAFLAAYEAHGKDMGPPDFYILLSYVQGLIQVEAAKRAISSGDITRAGYMKALHSIEDWNAGGLIQPVNLSQHPYLVTERIRIIKPDFEKKTWASVAGYAKPKMELMVD